MPVHYFDPNGVESLRDNGYRDTAMALSELIDNSLQAEATKIDIILIERQPEPGRQFIVDEILTIDNGKGMSKPVLETSLRFGGGTRHGAQKGLGKFGMGLPNSSASQAPRFEVFTWEKETKILFNYFDFEEIKSNQSEYLPEVEEVKLPEQLKKIIKSIYKHGTIVRWVSCDRLVVKKASNLVPRIEWPLGRIFRHFINNQEVQITIKVYQDNGYTLSEQTEYRRLVKPVDPLFLMTNTQLQSPFDTQATSELWEEGEYLFPDPKGDQQNKLLFDQLQDSVKLKFSVATKETQLVQTGHSDLGNIYEEFQGISIVRAGREIRIDDFGFIENISDPRNRWWKIELSFEPTFDKILGVDNTKQNVHNFKKVKKKTHEEGSGDEFTMEFMTALSKFITNQISSMNKEINSRNKGAKSLKGSKGENDIPPGPFPEDANPVPHPTPKIEDEDNPSDEEKDEAKEWLLLRYPAYAQDKKKLGLAIKWFFSNQYNQFVVFLQLGSAEFYSYKSFGHKTIIEVNTNHDFYQEFIRPIFDEGDMNKMEPLLLLFGAMVEAEKELAAYEKYITRFRSSFAVKLNQFILDWKVNEPIVQ